MKEPMEFTTDAASKPCRFDVVLFDFGGVLAEEGFREGLHAIAEFNRLESEPFVKTGFRLMYEVGYVLGHTDERSYWQAMREETGIAGSDENLRNTVLAHFKLRPWMIELTKELKASQIRLAILSDQTDWLDELDIRHDFFRRFERVFNSYHMGKSKKDATLFNDVLALMGVKPGKALFVDDSHENIERAKLSGLNTIWYQDRPRFFQELTFFCSSP